MAISLVNGSKLVLKSDASIDAQTSYVDITSTFTTGSTYCASIINTTGNLLPDTPVGTQRVVKNIMLSNSGSDGKIEIFINYASTNYSLFKADLKLSQSVGWTENGGWQKYTKAGSNIFNSSSYSVDIQTFTSTGSYIWYKPTTFTPRFVRVLIWGGGGGGGGGGASTDSVQRTGGTGGGGGAMNEATWPASWIPDKVNVDVGRGGDGGRGGISPAVGVAGEDGGRSAFGNLLYAYGGAGGGPGAITAVGMCGGAGGGRLGAPTSPPTATAVLGGAPTLALGGAPTGGGGSSSIIDDASGSMYGGAGGGGRDSGGGTYKGGSSMYGGCGGGVGASAFSGSISSGGTFGAGTDGGGPLKTTPGFGGLFSNNVATQTGADGTGVAGGAGGGGGYPGTTNPSSGYAGGSGGARGGGGGGGGPGTGTGSTGGFGGKGGRGEVIVITW